MPATRHGGTGRRRRRAVANAPSGGMPASVLPKLHVWLDATQELYVDGAIVDTIHDWSGHNYHFLTELTPSRSPRFKKPGTVNAKPSFFCDGVSGPQMVRPATDIMAGVAAAELYVVCKAAAIFGGLHQFSPGSCYMPYDTYLHLADAFGKAVLTGKFDPAVPTVSPIGLNVPVLVHERAYAAGWFGSINGKTVAQSANAEAVVWSNPVKLFRNVGGDSFKGEICEVIVTNQILTVPEQASMLSYFLTKYNIALIP